MKGTYLLILHLDAEVSDLPVGRLGRFTFAPGYYLYVGSAFGSGGLPARLAYHQRRVKAHPHWHIDYLRAHARLIESWSVVSPASLERAWARSLAGLQELSIPVPKFGASDVDSRSHLFYAPRRPGPRALTEALLAGLPPDQGDLASFTVEITHYDNGA